MNMPTPSRVRVGGPLASYANGFREELARLGYSSSPAAGHLQLMAHLSRWLADRDLDPGELTAGLVEQFLRDRRASGRVHRRLTVRGVAPLLGYLRGLGVVPEPPPVTAGPLEVGAGRGRDRCRAARTWRARPGGGPRRARRPPDRKRARQDRGECERPRTPPRSSKRSRALHRAVARRRPRLRGPRRPAPGPCAPTLRRTGSRPRARAHTRGRRGRRHQRGPGGATRRPAGPSTRLRQGESRGVGRSRWPGSAVARRRRRLRCRRPEQSHRQGRWLARLGLQGYEDTYPHALSGGEAGGAAGQRRLRRGRERRRGCRARRLPRPPERRCGAEPGLARGARRVREAAPSRGVGRVEAKDTMLPTTCKMQRP